MNTIPISAEIASALLLSVSYEPLSGALFWRERTAGCFVSRPKRPATAIAAAFNRQFAGKPAFSAVTAHGYLNGSFLGQRLYAHQVAWLLGTGCWPRNVIDHINGCKTDNRMENLREVLHSVNLKNAGTWSSNTSGHTGVWKHKSKKSPWAASIMVDQKNIFLGNFPTIEDAVAARTAAEHALGFSPRHGK